MNQRTFLTAARWRRSCLPLGATLALAACDGTPEPKPKPATPQAAPAEAAPAPTTPAPPPVPTWAEWTARVAAEVKLAHAAEAAALQKEFKAAGADAKPLKALVGAGTMRLVDRGGAITADGLELLDELQQLDRHGIDKSAYRIKAIDEATAAVTAALHAERAVWLSLERQPQAALVAAAASQWLRGGEGSAVELARKGGDQLGKAGLMALDRALPALVRAANASRLALVRAEVELLRATLRYAIDATLGMPAHPQKYTAPTEIKRMADKHADELVRLIDGGKGRLGDALRGRQPTHTQYPLLLGAFDTYRRLVDAGGWTPLPKLAAKQLKKGESSPMVAALRARLRAEGYDPGPDGERFDDALEAAVKLFQARHQLDADGVVTKTVCNELDVPAEKRLRQIQLSLQRLRESEGRDPGDEFHIWVNIAQQTLWVYDKGAPIDRHRVIVGNNDTDTDQLTALKGKINRTKMFSHKMTRVILAPKWFPTSRVVELELQPKLAKDPGFLEKEGYVREMQADGTEVWYQKAGKSNLLGDVKFQGPNKFNIYLHDTPFRHLFSKARRPFSHGCVRVDKPVDLAELVLGRDRGMSAKEIRDAIKEREEKEIKLKTPIPVHIDYVIASVDEEGQVVFGYDVYGYDQAYFDGALPVEEAKEYKAGSTRGL
ncbi:MAG: L,D-transpeptidase family protein [Deltaproteobacteria bacterium]|nr:L,D-transpeptidase family protein [Deltaproteobacteria bacterium]